MEYSSGEERAYCWPLTGIVVNIVKDPNSGDEFRNTEFWMKRFSNFNPEAVELLVDDKKQSVTVLVRFNTDWIGFKNAMEFEKYFESAQHSKKEWSTSENLKGSCVYAWIGRANDFKSQGPIGDYLRENRELKTIADLVQEDVKETNRVVMKLESEVDMRMLEETHSPYQACNEDLKRLAREFPKMVLDNKKFLNADLINRLKRELDRQIKAAEIFVRLVKELKREQEELSEKVLVLERHLGIADAKQKQEMEIEVMNYLSDEDDTTVQEQIKKIYLDVVTKMEEMDGKLQAFEELIKWDREEALKTAVELRTEVDAKLKLEMGIAGLKAKL